MSVNPTKPTLDNPVTYQITVPGRLDPGWIEEDWIIQLTTGTDQFGQPVSIITGKMDQAALHGLLRRIYHLGLPLMSVIWLRFSD